MTRKDYFLRTVAKWPQVPYASWRKGNRRAETSRNAPEGPSHTKVFAVLANTSAQPPTCLGREDKFDRLVTSNVIGIVSATEQSIETANDAFLRMVGYSREDFDQNKISWRAITPREYDHLDDFALTEMRERGEFTTFNKEYIRKDGTRIPIRIGGTVVSNHPFEWVCFIIDRTKEAEYERKLEDQFAQQQLLLNELDHRLRNLFAIANGLVAMTARSAETPLQMEELLRGRLDTLVKAHDLLRKAGARASAELRDVLQLTVVPLSKENNIVMSGPPVLIGSKHIVNLTLFFQEKATNALKYGALSVEGGKLDITWRIEGDRLLVLWRERSNATFPDSPERRGFGTKLADLVIKGQLGGEFEREWHRNGLTIRVSIPVANLAY